MDKVRYGGVSIPTARVQTSTVFFALLLIGGDLLSIDIAGFTLRIVMLVIMVGWLANLSRRSFLYAGTEVFMVSAAILAAALVSVPFSVDVGRSIGYLAGLVFCFLVLVPFFVFYSKNSSPQRVLAVWFWSYRLQTIMIALQFGYGLLVLGEFSRPHLWFYEPSYVAICFSAYCAAAIYVYVAGVRSAWIDVVFALATLAMLISATAVFAVAIAGGINLLVAKNKGRLALFALAILGAAVLAISKSSRDSTAYLLMFDYLRPGNELVYSIVERSGNRYPRLLWGIEAARESPWVGVGVGADQSYTETMEVPSTVAANLAPWEEIRGKPFVNPFIEAFATMGIPGFLAMLLVPLVAMRFWFVLSAVRAGMTRSEMICAKALAVAFPAMFITLQFEGTVLRFYVWSTFALLAGVVARCRRLSSVN